MIPTHCVVTIGDVSALRHNPLVQNPPDRGVLNQGVMSESANAANGDYTMRSYHASRTHSSECFLVHCYDYDKAVCALAATDCLFTM